jgi:predicted secreted protein with PEFG-CTERM motif
MAATTFSFQFDEEGDYPYFCMVHPWMEGIVKVQSGGAAPMPTVVMDLNEIMAEIQTSNGMANEVMTIDLTLTDLDGNGIEHITYNIKAMQGSNVILDEEGHMHKGTHITYNIKAMQGSDVVLDEEGHMHKGTLTNTHTTSSLTADASDSMPVEITIESVGFGHDDLYVDASGEIATKQVVPEFGTIAAMILAVAIVSIIAISAKSKLSIMPRI